MAYAKTLIGNITKGAITQRGNKRLQALADTCDENFTDIEETLTDIAVEATADLVGGMVTGNTETGITVTYQDADNTLDFEVSAEFIADTVGAMVAGNTETGIAVTYDDADNTLDFVLGAHAHTASAGDGAVLTGYQATPFASTLTLTQMGIVPPVAPDAWAGTAMGALTGASTFQQLLNAISTDIATAGT